jgi:hypothetical protein
MADPTTYAARACPVCKRLCGETPADRRAIPLADRTIIRVVREGDGPRLACSACRHSWRISPASQDDRKTT